MIRPGITRSDGALRRTGPFVRLQLGAGPRGPSLDGGALLSRWQRTRRRPLESPFDVLVRVLRGKERPFARVRDPGQDVVPETIDVPVPPAPCVRAEGIPEVPNLVLRREVHVADRSDMFDPGRDAPIVRKVLQ